MSRVYQLQLKVVYMRLSSTTAVNQKHPSRGSELFWIFFSVKNDSVKCVYDQRVIPISQQEVNVTKVDCVRDAWYIFFGHFLSLLSLDTLTAVASGTQH